MCRTLENASRELGSKIKQILFFCLRIIFNAFISLNDAAQTSGGVNVHTHTVSAPIAISATDHQTLGIGETNPLFRQTFRMADG